MCLLNKWLFKLINEEGLWQTMLKRKYLKSQTITHVQKKLGDSQFWSGLMKVKDSFLSLGRFKLNNGVHIQFWEDKWPGIFPSSIAFLHCTLSCERKTFLWRWSLVLCHWTSLSVRGLWVIISVCGMVWWAWWLILGWMVHRILLFGDFIKMIFSLLNWCTML
jgi:hypothetical protein